jgi:toxin ParE1/3/4
MPKTVSLVFRRKALADLLALRTHIAENAGHDRAGIFVARIEDHCRSLTLFSKRGATRAGFSPGVRIAPFRRQAIIAYIVDEARDRLIVLRVFGAGQDYDAALRSDDDDADAPD